MVTKLSSVIEHDKNHDVALKMGSTQQLHLDLLRYHLYPADHPYTTLLQNYAQRLGIDPEKVRCQRSPVPNGFAYPTGEIVITEGLLHLIKFEEELFAILAHEQTHVLNGDAEELRRRRELGKLSISDYRNVELRADLNAQKIMSESGVNPYGNYSLLKRLEVLEIKGTRDTTHGDIIRYTDSTHGTLSTRVALQRESLLLTDLPCLRHSMTPLQLPDISNYAPGDSRSTFEKFLFDSMHEIRSGRVDVGRNGLQTALDNNEIAMSSEDKALCIKVLEYFALGNKGYEVAFTDTELELMADSRHRDLLGQLGIQIDDRDVQILGLTIVRKAAGLGRFDIIKNLIAAGNFETTMITRDTKSKLYEQNANIIGAAIEGVLFQGGESIASKLISMLSPVQSKNTLEEFQKSWNVNKIPSISSIAAQIGITEYNLPAVISTISLNSGYLFACDYIESREKDPVTSSEKFLLESFEEMKRRTARFITRYVAGDIRAAEKSASDSSKAFITSQCAFGMTNVSIVSSRLTKITVSAPVNIVNKLNKIDELIDNTFLESCDGASIEELINREHKRTPQFSPMACAMAITTALKTQKTFANANGSFESFGQSLDFLALQSESKDFFLGNVDLLLRSRGQMIATPEDLKKISSLIVKSLELRQRIDPGFDPCFGREEQAKIAEVSKIVSRLVSNVATIDGIPKALSLATRFMTIWPILSSAKASMDEHLQIFDTTLNAYLLAHPRFGTTSKENINLLNLIIIARPNDITGLKVSAELFKRVLDRATNFDHAIAVLEMYRHLPIAIIEDGFKNYLNRNDFSWKELEILHAKVMEKLKTDESGKTLVKHHLAEAIISLGTPSGTRGEIARNMLMTTLSDKPLRNQLSSLWWKSNFNSNTSLQKALGEITREAHGIEEKQRTAHTHNNFKEQYRPVVGKIKQPLPIEKNLPRFEGLFQEIGVAGPFFQHIMLRELLLGGIKGSHHNAPILDDPSYRRDFFKSLIIAYAGEKSVLEQSTAIGNLLDGVANGPISEDLFFYLGRPLASLASQEPKEATPRNWIPPKFSEEALLNAIGVSKVPGLLHDQKFVNTRAIARAAVTGLFLGKGPDKISWDKHTGTLRVTDPKLIEEDVSFKELVTRQFINRDANALMLQDATLVDLTILFAEHTGALGRRYLQFDAMLRADSYTEQDKEKIELSYDRSPLMNSVQIYAALDEEQQKDPAVKAFVDQIDIMYPIEHGGSLFTVAKVRDKSGKMWAVQVLNPNASFFADDLSLVVNDLIDALPRAVSADKKNMSRAVLNGARQWTVNEVRDPHFYENQSAFTDYNSLNSGDHDSDRFRQEAIDPEFRMVVPEFLKLNSSRIRIQEWFDGETLVRMKPSQKTDVQANQISVEDAKSVSKMLVANFFHQLLETGVVHSNFHPGQFMVSNEKRIAILDTKNILRFSESERHAIIDAGIKVFMGDKKGAVTDLLTEICGPRENIDKVASDILEKISKVSSADLPEYVTAILGTLYENGIELDNKWMLLGQNLLGLRRTLMKLGYSAGSIGLLGDGMSLDQVATVLPKTFAYIQLKLQ